MRARVAPLARTATALLALAAPLVMGAALAPVPAAAAAGTAAAAADTGAGCHPGQPAVAHYPNGAVLQPQPTAAPVPCGMPTGYAGGESAIAVTNAGAVLYAPAVQATAGLATQYFLGGNAGFARTTDLGRTWSFVDPIAPNVLLPITAAGHPGYPAWDQIDDKFYLDRDTGRLFWTDPDLPGEVVLRTDDDGLSWGYSLLPVGFGGEWTQVTTARPRTSSTTGYPKVVYACGEYDTIGRDFTTALEGDLCQKSRDGGQTWVTAGQGLFGAPTAPHSQCQGQTEHPDFSPWAAPDSRGRLYELLFCAGHTYLLRSDDEAATWSIVDRVPYDLPAVGPGGTGTAELRSDSADNLYLAWATGGNPNPNGGYTPGGVDLIISHDLGRSWGAAMGVLAPGVIAIRTHFGFDVGAPGQVAISYLGHKNGRDGYDGYLTQTADALDPRPLFWSGVVNDSSQTPLDSGGRGSSNGLGLDYISAAVGPDGTAWASYWDACGEDLPSPSGCPASRKTPGTTTFGFTDFAGRLTPLPAPATAPGTGTANVNRLVGLPPAASCASRRHFRIRLQVPRGAGVRRAIVRVNGRRVRVLRGARLHARVNLRGLPRGTFQVRITLKLADGRTLTSTRTYHTCARKHRHRLARRG